MKNLQLFTFLVLLFANYTFTNVALGLESFVLKSADNNRVARYLVNKKYKAFFNKECICKIIVAIISCVFSFVLPHQLFAASDSLHFFEANNKNIQYVGRIDFSNPNLHYAIHAQARR